MIARRFAAAGALGLAIAAFVPGVAQAAPVSVSAALLSAAEFPEGSSAYKTSIETIRKSTAPEDTSKCAKLSYDQDVVLAGTRQSQAVVRRGPSFLAAGIADRPMKVDLTEYWRVCLAEDAIPTRVLATPPDLARYQPMLIAIGNSMYQAAVDIRGVTVLSGTTNRSGGPADFDGFWQVLRTQIAKVERQP